VFWGWQNLIKIFGFTHGKMHGKIMDLDDILHLEKSEILPRFSFMQNF